VREVIEKAQQQRGIFTAKNPILFIDEIHRFSKTQQDSLLAAVEKGIITLIGATTENPSFEVNKALLSRCQVLLLKAHDQDSLLQILKHAITYDVLLSKLAIELKETDALIRLSGGDARRLLNLFELIINGMTESPKVITNAQVLSLADNVIAQYDKTGEMHYDIISAFIKSIRGSDPNAAVYYLARMLIGGEDIKFIARRLVILASEDIGLANPTALVTANACFEAVAKIGMPEARIILSQCAIYLATSPKSNSAYAAINAAMEKSKQNPNASIPLQLRNAPTELMKSLDYGKNYQYAHDYESSFVVQDFLPKALSKHSFYKPGNNPREASIKKFLEDRWKDYYEF
ncbi:MAG: replication-associated recombination protein A, partial [Flavobacteriaceae bacterium]|nr:replication-associated recombination protein A [Flavobacteriaceae bacterium]